MESTIPAPVSRTRPMSTPFTLASVATGMNSGVGTLPCGVVSVPARAAPSVAAISKANPGCMRSDYRPAGHDVNRTG